MSNKALLAAALCAMVLPASASAQYRIYSGGRVVGGPLVVEGFQAPGPIWRGNMAGYYGTNNARRLNFYELPRYHWYGNNFGYPYEWPYGEVPPLDVPRFTSTYPLPAEVYEPYYVAYNGTEMPTGGTPQLAPQPSTKPPITTASIKVYVPTSTAEVWCNGVKIAQTGPSREIVTPELASGRAVSCEIRVEWMENGKSITQTRTAAQLRPGSQVVLAFSAE